MISVTVSRALPDARAALEASMHERLNPLVMHHEILWD
jgi:hypothetical protein